ncbi:MAG TPA: hypothetical protein VN723_05710 [Rhizomicrobium sp.]|nr:hypothetical protein [Rhizomicrobium sp.]
MSDVFEEGLSVAVDPISGLDKDTPPEQVRTLAAAWAKNGMPLDKIQSELAVRGLETLNINSAEFATARADAIERDPVIQKAIADGTIEGQKHLAEISALRMFANKSGDSKMTDRPHTAEDYLAPVHSALAASGVHDFDPAYVAGLQATATALQLDPIVLSGIIQTSADASRETRSMSPEQRDIWEQRQVASLESLFSAETLDAANKELSKHEAKFDIRKSARQGGALAAATLLHFLQAQSLKH